MAQTTKTKSWFTTLVKEQMYKTKTGETVIYPAICQTTEYDKIVRIASNREPIPNHVKKILDSVIGLSSNNRDIIVVYYNGKYCIADGQHLFYSLVGTGLPARFKLVNVETTIEAITVMRKMNSSSRNWTIRQYINSTAQINSHYAILANIMEEYNKIQPNLIGGILYCTQKFQNKMASDAIKEGTFQVNLKPTEYGKRLSAISRFHSVTNMKPDQYNNWGFIDFLIDHEKPYSKKEDKFLHEVKNTANKRKLTTFGNRLDMYNFLTECWNKI